MIFRIELKPPQGGPVDPIWGYILNWLDPNNPASAREQLDAGYRHAGGWRPFPGHGLTDKNWLTYPGDPAMPPLDEIKLREETVAIYPHGWVAIIQPNRTFEVCRMD